MSNEVFPCVIYQGPISKKDPRIFRLVQTDFQSLVVEQQEKDMMGQLYWRMQESQFARNFPWAVLMAYINHTNHHEEPQKP